jgi:hypothetical protein
MNGVHRRPDRLFPAGKLNGRFRHFRIALRERLAARTWTTNKNPLKSSAPLDGSGTA